jgi:calcium-dependent protein kinase
VQTSLKKRTSHTISAFQNLRTFNSERKMQSALFKYVANHMIDPEQEIGLRELFDSMDEDGNGTLSKEELAEGLQVVSEHFGFDLNDQNFEQLVDSIDINRNGTIDY